MPNRDPSSASNYDAWRTKHTTADLTIDFKAKSLRGVVTLELESQTDKASSEIILDSSHVAVSRITVNAAETQWSVKPRTEPLGSPVHIAVPAESSAAIVAKGATITVAIHVSTTAQCTALQWLTPEQTSSKKAPFMFSQCQAIHARSLFPCQDTPDVKSTVSFRITSPYVVLASGVAAAAADGEPESQGDGEKLYSFEQKVPIPSYLFALASGDLAQAPIGPRSFVATGPDELEACKWEFERDMEKFMEVAEGLVFPYKWGQYNVLVLPPSFPYGGMENPIWTFATPTVVSGDRENVDVIAHELSHSWSGNLVTAGSWEHFWLNEGWTTYLERRILAAVHGDAYFDFSAVIGWKDLQDSVDDFNAAGEQNFTQLLIDHTGIDPDDAFSKVAYEKGFHMVWSLDRLVGRKNFDKFIPYYFTKWTNKSLDSYEFKATFLEFFSAPEYADLEPQLATIDWEGRFYNQGMPPEPKFDTSLIDVCYKLAAEWKDPHFTPKPSDVAALAANQKLVLLQQVKAFAEPLSAAQAEKMGTVYDFVHSQNVEVKAAYFEVSLQSKVVSTYAPVAELLGQVGRMKFVRPLFSALNRVDRELALSTFEKNKDFYHPICKAMVAKALGVPAEA
ncbi:unnamed protein product [Discula destructiva]